MEFSKKEIIEIANKVKDFVDKNKVLPLYVDKGSRITKAQYLYLFGKLISIINAKGVNKQAYTEQVITKSDKINVNLSKVEYLDVSKRVVKFMETNKKNPAYVNVKGKQVSTDLVNYCFAKILVWYGKHNNTLPLTCLFNSDDLVKKNIINSSTSSNVNKTIFNNADFSVATYKQDTNYNCGINCLEMAFIKLTGIKVNESTLGAWAGTTTAGTSHQGLEICVKKFNQKYGKNLKISWKNFSDLSWKEQGQYLSSKNSFLFYHLAYHNHQESGYGTKGFGHYETLKTINLNSDTLKVYNSLSGGYIDNRSKATQKKWCSQISQKSLCIISK